jgi:hypothetical protein
VSLLKQYMWFMRDGAPPVLHRTVSQHLIQNFGGEWIGRGGPVSSPTQAADVNPLDVWLWGHPKSWVYSELVNDFEVLHQRVENPRGWIRVRPGKFKIICEEELQVMLIRMGTT